MNVRMNVRGGKMLYLIYILVLIIFALAGYAVLQIRLFGITVKDFWNFIEANQTLDKLYEYSKRFDKLSPTTTNIIFKRSRNNI